jgi:histidyl-tRNA synthetase
MKKSQPVRGTSDLFGEEYLIHEYIIQESRLLSECFGFEPISTPIFEFTEVFTRSLGDTSDVVTKEMYNFQDKGGDDITLRPEFTAAICRALISNGLFHKLPLKFFSFGPLFRYERPQKGRSRQFHQINFEALGFTSYHTDAEIISLVKILLEKLQIKAKLEINSIGCNETRAKYKESLISYLEQYKNDLSEESKIRLEKNPLRILDSKNEVDKKIIQNAPKISEFYSVHSRDFFEKLLEKLQSLNIQAEVNDKLVRGLDYYNDTVFEWVSDELGAQSTVAAGGRYDRLVETMGGTPTPAFGFAAGIERLALLTKYRPSILRPIALISLGEASGNFAAQLALSLRELNLSIFIEYDLTMTKQMKKANKILASHALIIGEDELNTQIVTLKDLDTGVESKLPFGDIKKTLILLQGRS